MRSAGRVPSNSTVTRSTCCPHLSLFLSRSHLSHTQISQHCNIELFISSEEHDGSHADGVQPLALVLYTSQKLAVPSLDVLRDGWEPFVIYRQVGIGALENARNNGVYGSSVYVPLYQRTSDSTSGTRQASIQKNTFQTTS